MTVGLFAPWGSGKSQMLHLIKLQLLTSNAIHVAASEMGRAPACCMKCLACLARACVDLIFPTSHWLFCSATAYGTKKAHLAHCTDPADKQIREKVHNTYLQTKKGLQDLEALPCHYIPVWFNCWVYTGSEHLWAGMLTEMQKALEREYGKRYLRFYRFCTSSLFHNFLLPLMRRMFILSCFVIGGLPMWDDWRGALLRHALTSLCFIGYAILTPILSNFYACFAFLARVLTKLTMYRWLAGRLALPGCSCSCSCQTPRCWSWCWEILQNWFMQQVLLFMSGLGVLASVQALLRLLLPEESFLDMRWADCGTSRNHSNSTASTTNGTGRSDYESALPHCWASFPLWFNVSMVPLLGIFGLVWPVGPWKSQILNQVTGTASSRRPARDDFSHLLGPMQQIRKEMLYLRTFIQQKHTWIRALRGELFIPDGDTSGQDESSSSEGALQNDVQEADDENGWMARAGRQQRSKMPRKRLVIVIDDLDRCPQDKAVEVLQSLHLLSEGMPFFIILAMDLRVVSKMVENTLGEQLVSNGINGVQYIDKIVQLPFAMPALSVDQRAQLLEKRLNDIEISNASAEIRYTQLDAEDEDEAQDEEAENEGDRQNDDSDPAPQLESIHVEGQKTRCDDEHVQERLDKGQEPRSDDKHVQERLDTERMEDPTVGIRGSSTSSPKISRPGLSPEEKRLWKRYSPFLDSNPRRILRLLNIYNVSRILQQSLDELIERPSFEELLKSIILFEQWPYRMSWLLKVIEADHYQEAELYQEESKTLGSTISRDDSSNSDVGSKLQNEETLGAIFPAIEEYCWDISLWDGSHSHVYIDHRSSLGMDSAPELFDQLMASAPQLRVSHLRPMSLLLRCIINRNQAVEERVAFQASQRLQLHDGSWQRRSQVLLKLHSRARAEAAQDGSEQHGVLKARPHRLTRVPIPTESPAWNRNCEDRRKSKPGREAWDQRCEDQQPNGASQDSQDWSQGRWSWDSEWTRWPGWEARREGERHWKSETWAEAQNWGQGCTSDSEQPWPEPQKRGLSRRSWDPWEASQDSESEHLLGQQQPRSSAPCLLGRSTELPVHAKPKTLPMMEEDASEAEQDCRPSKGSEALRVSCMKTGPSKKKVKKTR
eukprot:TRINITY_DN5061_c1_g1_i3.p1 TRINITY_DN5061_c1_g1~~TRINITY_DN5061_c1_g1_i3.p1  ORF type:complete len:1114 (-),score=181.40 TRINITY_DN5061_c1_g1_i3:29-3370(-)